MEEFKSALSAWVDAVIAAFQLNKPDCVESRAWPPQSRWREDPNGHYVLVDEPQLSWTLDFLEMIRGLPSYATVEAAAAADPIVAAHLNRVVGTVLARHTRDLAGLAGSVLPTLVLVASQPELAANDSFEDRWTRLERFLLEDSIEITVFWPLAGVSVDDVPLALNAELELDRATSAEIDLALRHGIIPLPFANMPFAALDSSKRFCLRYHYVLPKVIGEDPEPDGGLEKAAAIFATLDAIAADFIQALALVGPGRFGVLGRIEHETVQLYGQGVRWSPITEHHQLRFGGDSLNLGAAEAAVLKDHWRHIHAEGFQGRNRGLSLALRRFSAHRLRKDLDDQILDLMIAAEALYLSELGNDKYRGELRNRLALRAAFWTDPETVMFTRPEVYELVQSAYDARSAVAHGGQPKAKDLKVRGARVNLDELLEATRSVLRHALGRAVPLTVGDSTWTVDWDQEITDQLIGPR